MLKLQIKNTNNINAEGTRIYLEDATGLYDAIKNPGGYGGIPLPVVAVPEEPTLEPLLVTSVEVVEPVALDTFDDPDTKFVKVTLSDGTLTYAIRIAPDALEGVLPDMPINDFSALQFAITTETNFVAEPYLLPSLIVVPEPTDPEALIVSVVITELEAVVPKAFKPEDALTSKMYKFTLSDDSIQYILTDVALDPTFVILGLTLEEFTTLVAGTVVFQTLPMLDAIAEPYLLPYFGETINPLRGEQAIVILGLNKSTKGDREITFEPYNPLAADKFNAIITTDGWYHFSMLAFPILDESKLEDYLLGDIFFDPSTANIVKIEQKIILPPVIEVPPVVVVPPVDTPTPDTTPVPAPEDEVPIGTDELPPVDPTPVIVDVIVASTAAVDPEAIDVTDDVSTVFRSITFSDESVAYYKHTPAPTETAPLVTPGDLKTDVELVWTSFDGTLAPYNLPSLVVVVIVPPVDLPVDPPIDPDVPVEPPVEEPEEDGGHHGGGHGGDGDHEHEPQIIRFTTQIPLIDLKNSEFVMDTCESFFIANNSKTKLKINTKITELIYNGAIFADKRLIRMKDNYNVVRSILQGSIYEFCRGNKFIAQRDIEFLNSNDYVSE